MSAGTLAVRTSSRRLTVAGALVVCLLVPASAGAARHEVTVAVRVEGEAGQNVRLRVALPPEPATDTAAEPEVHGRGLQSEIGVDDGGRRVMFTGRVTSPRRVAVTFAVDGAVRPGPFPEVVPLDDPLPELLPYMDATPLFQSRSILVREFLEQHVGPLLASGDVNPLRAIYATTRKQLKWDREGKTLTLDVLRAGGGQRIGLERAFTTFLRCARIPARFVEGIDLASSTRTKRVYWTEVWADDAWWPVSASRGWIGKIPPSYVPLARDGFKVVEMDGSGRTSYSVQTRLLVEDSG